MAEIERREMMKIVIEDDVFVTESASTVSTKMYISDNGNSFPNEKWTDFAFPVLEWWKNSTLSMEHSDNHVVVLPFEDGPFRLKVHKDEKMLLKIECINDRNVAKVELTIYCGYYEFLYALYNAFKTFGKVLYNNGMHRGAFSSVYQQTLLSIETLKTVLKDK